MDKEIQKVVSLFGEMGKDIYWIMGGFVSVSVLLMYGISILIYIWKSDKEEAKEYVSNTIVKVVVALLMYPFGPLLVFVISKVGAIFKSVLTILESAWK